MQPHKHLARLGHPLAVAALIVLLGPGVLTTMYLSANWPTPPGLFYFRSAIIGDGLLLPVAAGCLVHLGTFRSGTSVSRRIVATGGMAGGFIGAVIVALNVIDDAPRRNWTLPSAHSPNVAGIYHAAYLIVVVAVFAALVTRMLVRVAASEEDRRAQIFGSIAWVLTISCLGGFAVLVLRDNGYVDSAEDVAMVAVAGVAIMLVALIAAWIARASWIRNVFVSIGASAPPVVTVGTVAVVTPDPLFAIVAIPFAALSSAVFSAAIHHTAARRTRHAQATFFLSCIGIYLIVGLTPVLAPNIAVPAFMLVGTTGFVALVVLHGLLRISTTGVPLESPIGDDYRLKDVAVTPYMLMLLAAVGVWSFNHSMSLAGVYGAALLATVGFICLTIIYPTIRRQFTEFAKAEERSTTDGSALRAQQTRAKLIAIAFVSAFLASVTALLLVTAATAVSNGYRSGAAPAITWYYPMLFGGAGSLALLISAQVLSRRQRGGLAPTALVLLAALTWASVLLADIDWNNPSWTAGVPAWMFIGPSVFVAIWFFVSLRSNYLLLQRLSVDKRHLVVIYAIAVAIGVSALWASTSGIRYDSEPVRLIDALIALVFFWIVSLALALAARSCVPRPSSSIGTNYPPEGVVAQDWFSMTGISTVIMWTPALIAAHIPDGTPGRWLNIAIVSGGFVAVFTGLFTLGVRLNTRHATFREHRFKYPNSPWDPHDRDIKLLPMRGHELVRAVASFMRPSGFKYRAYDTAEFVEALKAHTATQNLLSLTMVGVTIVGLPHFVQYVIAG